MRTHGEVVGRRFRSVTKLTKVRIGAMGEFSYCCRSAQNTHEKWLYRPRRQPQFSCACGGGGGCADGGVRRGAVPALSWCGEVSLGGRHIIIESGTCELARHSHTAGEGWGGEGEIPSGVGEKNI